MSCRRYRVSGVYIVEAMQCSTFYKGAVQPEDCWPRSSLQHPAAPRSVDPALVTTKRTSLTAAHQFTPHLSILTSEGCVSQISLTSWFRQFVFLVLPSHCFSRLYPTFNNPPTWLILEPRLPKLPHMPGLLSHLLSCRLAGKLLPDSPIGPCILMISRQGSLNGTQIQRDITLYSLQQEQPHGMFQQALQHLPQPKHSLHIHLQSIHTTHSKHNRRTKAILLASNTVLNKIQLPHHEVVH